MLMQESDSAPQLPSALTADQASNAHMQTSPDIAGIQAVVSEKDSALPEAEGQSPQLQQLDEAAELRSDLESSAMMLSVPEDADSVAAEGQSNEVMAQPSLLQAEDEKDPLEAGPNGLSSEAGFSLPPEPGKKPLMQQRYIRPCFAEI